MTEQQSGQSMTVESVVGQQEGIEKQPFNLLVWMSSRGIFVFTTLLVVIAAIFVDGFASLDNITDVFNRAAPIGIVAVGMTFVVISANYLDLSVVAQVATAAVVLIAVSNETNIPTAMALAFVIALLYGLVNGVAVGVFQANAVIVTLSTTFIGLGILRWFSGGSIYFGPQDGAIRSFGLGKARPVPMVDDRAHRDDADPVVRADENELRVPRSVVRLQSRGDVPGRRQHGLGRHRSLHGYLDRCHDRRIRSRSVLQHRRLRNVDRVRLPGARSDHRRRHQRVRWSRQRPQDAARRRLRQRPHEHHGPVRSRIRRPTDGDRGVDRRSSLGRFTREKGGRIVTDQQTIQLGADQETSLIGRIRVTLARRTEGRALALLLIVAIATWFTEPIVFTSYAVTLGRVALIGLVALGLTAVILMGELDLSVASTLAVTGVVMASIENLTVGILAALAVGLLIGVVNAFFVVVVGINSFVATSACSSSCAVRHS